MPDYIHYPQDFDSYQLAQDAFDYLAAHVPGWSPSPGNLESILIEAMARMVAEAGEVASDVPRSIFRYFGASVVSLPPQDATFASGDSTWTMIDNAGYTIPAGTRVGIPAAGDELVAFAVVSNVTVPPGSTATAAGEVQLAAVVAGEEGSGLTADPELIDALDYVADISLVGTTTGGLDAESDEDYLNRLRAEFQLFSPRPILPDDFATLAQRIAGVDRALAIDGYNPLDDTDNNERMITVVPVNENGDPVSSGTKAAVDADLQARREVNFVVHVIDPTYTTIDVTWEAVALPDYDTATVEAEAEVAVAAYIDPANWGQPRTSNEREWIDQPVMRYLEVAQVINNVEGIDYITSLTLGLGGGAQSSADVNLDGPAAMPMLGTQSGTVVAP